MAPDLNGKRLELLKEAFPKVTRVAFLWLPGGASGNLPLTEMEARPRRWDSSFNRSRCEAWTILKRICASKREGVQALITSLSGLISTQQRQVLDFAAKNGCRRCTKRVSGLRLAA